MLTYLFLFFESISVINSLDLRTETSSDNLNLTIGLLGLIMAITEVYLPSTSKFVEQIIDSSQDQFEKISNYLFNLAKKADQLYSNSILTTLTKKHLKKVIIYYFIIIYGLSFISYIFNYTFIFSYINTIFLIIMMLSTIAFIFITTLIVNVFSLFFLYFTVLIAISFIFLAAEILIKSLNIIGNDKAWSGIGLTMATYSVVEPYIVFH